MFKISIKTSIIISWQIPTEIKFNYITITNYTAIPETHRSRGRTKKP